MKDLLLISIKTKYANQILNGTKKYEFRRKSIQEKNEGKKIYIYSSEEEKAIVGYIIIDKILKGNLDYILDITNNKNNQDIIKYFNNSNLCYAYHISNYYKFKNKIYLKDIKKIDNSFTVPQFYRYLKEDEYIYNLLISNK